MSSADPVYFIFGYVEITGENGFAERFINCCTAEGIPLWDMRKKGGRIYAKTTIDGFRKIRGPAKKSSMKIRLTAKHGLPFITEKIFRKTGLIIGLSAAAVILAFLSAHVWIIEVDNDTDIPDEKIIAAYEDAGFKIGSRRNADAKKISAEVLSNLEEASWTTVNIVGSEALIKVRQVKETPDIEYPTGIANIIASKDGQVEIIEPYRGKPNVKAGQTVIQGGLLISGISEGKNEITVYSDSSGYVVADTNISVSHSAGSKITALVPKQRKVYSLYFLGAEIPLGRTKAADCVYCHESRLYIGGRKMPFGICYKLYTDFEEKKIGLKVEEAVLHAVNDYSLKAYNQTLHAQIVSKDVSVEKSGEKTEIHGEYYCYENIGKKVPVEFEAVSADETADEQKNTP